jgi:hypothetical protein
VKRVLIVRSVRISFNASRSSGYVDIRFKLRVTSKSCLQHHIDARA